MSDPTQTAVTLRPVPSHGRDPRRCQATVLRSQGRSPLVLRVPVLLGAGYGALSSPAQAGQPPPNLIPVDHDPFAGQYNPAP
jgi:hypothetical protein